MALEITSNNFEELVLKNDKPVLHCIREGLYKSNCLCVSPGKCCDIKRTDKTTGNQLRRVFFFSFASIFETYEKNWK